MHPEPYSLEQHDRFSEAEDRINAWLDRSLEPRGPEMLYELVAGMGLRAGADVLDLGCGVGNHCISLAERFGFRVTGIDAVERNVEECRLAAAGSSAGERIHFETGRVEAIPFDDALFDLVWCRDVLTMVEDLGAVYREIRRVLRPGGRALVYHMFATELLEPQEREWLLPVMGCYASSMDADHVEAAIRDAGLRIDECLVLGPEWGEYGMEATGKGGRKLLQAGRLLRGRERFVAEFGESNWDIAMGDSLWHVYRLIGKLSDRVYLLTAP